MTLPEPYYQEERTTWNRCYDSNWDGVIVPDAYSHPAKMARGLCERIFDYLFERGWLKKGDMCVDPFAGIFTTGIVGASRGVQVYGCELESRFVELANQNIELHRHTWKSFGDPVPVVLQGDSRELGKVLGSVLYRGGGRLAGADVCVGSPPFASSDSRTGGTAAMPKDKRAKTSVLNDKAFLKTCGRAISGEGYGTTPGNLGNMKSGDVDAVVSSPDYVNCDTKPTKMGSGKGTRADGDGAGRNKGDYHYSTAEGKLGAMKSGDVAAVVSSPPYEGSLATDDRNKLNETWKGKTADGRNRGGALPNVDYGSTEGQLGREQSDTFWAAAKTIVQQCHAILKPTGIAVFVCKDFVRAKQRVPFSRDWATLCESCGFELVEWIHASLVKEHRHPGLFGADEVRTKERKSFFRRLAEKKGSPRIDWEDVLIMRKPE